jgi:hypothetical protein
VAESKIKQSNRGVWLRGKREQHVAESKSKVLVWVWRGRRKDFMPRFEGLQLLKGFSTSFALFLAVPCICDTCQSPRLLRVNTWVLDWQQNVRQCFWEGRQGGPKLQEESKSGERAQKKKKKKKKIGPWLHSHWSRASLIFDSLSLWPSSSFLPFQHL